MLKKFFIVILCALTAVVVVLGGWLLKRHVVPIVMFHHVDTYSHEELNTISPKKFEKIMAFLKNHHYQVIRLEQLVDAINHHTKLAPRSVVLTFDDGYDNNYTYAFPILKKYQFPATIFVISNFIGKEDFLTPGHIKEMVNSGLIDIGSHTKNHVYLPGIKDRNSTVDEIAGSKSDLEKFLGRPVDYFCYPSGGFNSDIQSIVHQAGYKAACTTNRGHDKYNKDIYALKRVRLNNKDYDFSLLMKFSGYYGIFKETKDSD